MATIKDVRGVHNPQKSYLWEVSVLTSGILVPVRELPMYAKTVAIPQSAVDVTIINHKASKTSYAGRDASARTVTVTFWDDENQTVYSFLNGWMDIIHNSVSGAQVPRDAYAATLHIRLKDVTDSVTTSLIELGLAFPTDLSDVSLSYDSSEPVEISCTFSYDTKIVV